MLVRQILQGILRGARTLIINITSVNKYYCFVKKPDNFYSILVREIKLVRVNV